MKQGKSQAQDEIADIIGEAYPRMVVRQEVPVSDVIVASGYEPKELEPELRHKIHKMSIDIYATNYSTSFAIEYQGEQHYGSVGVMNGSENAVKWDQALDEEKMWVLQRVGVPIVQIAYDEPVSPTIIRHLVETASEGVRRAQNALYVCEGCGRRFPRERLSNGLCERCRGMSDNNSETDNIVTTKKGRKEADKERARKQRRLRWQEYKQSDAYAERKRQMKEARKRAMDEYKQSDAYKQRKEEEKERRKERRRQSGGNR